MRLVCFSLYYIYFCSIIQQHRPAPEHEKLMCRVQFQTLQVYNVVYDGSLGNEVEKEGQ